MAGRVKKNITLEEKLKLTNNKILETEKLLTDLKEQKKQLEKEIHDKQIEELDKLVSESGLSIEDIKKLITKNK